MFEVVQSDHFLRVRFAGAFEVRLRLERRLAMLRAHLVYETQHGSADQG